MTYRIEVYSFGIWVPFNTRYYKNKSNADEAVQRIIRTQLGGNPNLIRIRVAQ